MATRGRPRKHPRRQRGPQRALLTTEAFDDMTGLSLVLDERELLREVAGKLALAQRANIRAGRTPGGAPLQRPKPRKGASGRPLMRTGSLVRSLKDKAFKSRKGGWQAVVSAQGTRPDLGPKLRDRQGGLLGVLIYGKLDWPVRPREPRLMSYEGNLPPVAQRAFQEALKRSVSKGKSRIEKRNFLFGARRAAQGPSGLGERLLRGS